MAHENAGETQSRYRHQKAGVAARIGILRTYGYPNYWSGAGCGDGSVSGDLTTAGRIEEEFRATELALRDHRMIVTSGAAMRSPATVSRRRGDACPTAALGQSRERRTPFPTAMSCTSSALVGADTVTTVPPATMEAFRNHGRARVTLGTEETEAEAAALLAKVATLRLDLQCDH